MTNEDLHRIWKSASQIHRLVTDISNADYYHTDDDVQAVVKIYLTDIAHYLGIPGA